MAVYRDEIPAEKMDKEFVEVPPSTTAARFDEGKPDLANILYLPKTVELLARIFELGELKYSKLNWKNGGKPDDEYLNACLRHLYAWLNGETYDPEFGTNHLGHAIWNLMVLFELNHSDKILEGLLFQKALAKFNKESEKYADCKSYR